MFSAIIRYANKVRLREGIPEAKGRYRVLLALRLFSRLPGKMQLRRDHIERVKANSSLPVGKLFPQS